ncbi:zinc-dependent peptidase [Aquimarina sp. 2201CG14-23]|uniref:zinc-dependent peptidase n=1 Tax=Aquimarina mycalae TaxID=3040073 RepID=UPI002477F08C|nr:zinc-dependent peptidase [Aquimarina sp. 2201CG14-23]MDH7445137.1 zinc-dependent peptidase [Aquimarina sp. 2201CG14-23]
MIFIFLYILSFQETPEPGIPKFLGVILTIGIVSICIYYVSKYLETVYARMYQKPFFVHFYLFLKKIPPNLKPFLKTNSLYNQLDKRKKRYFEHRVVKFLETTKFVGREGLVVDDYKRMQVTMMVIQLTFGMRNYLLEYVETIILYPSSYYSILNKTQNNGEFNPRSKALVLSWEHFNIGNLHQEDGVNLGIHEITHAIHYCSLKSNNISSEIFHDTFLELEQHLSSVELRNKIIESKVLREYAFTDKFEFIAVLVEVFMESPEKLKKQFPDIYSYVSRMLNFRYFEA